MKLLLEVDKHKTTNRDQVHLYTPHTFRNGWKLSAYLRNFRGHASVELSRTITNEAKIEQKKACGELKETRKSRGNTIKEHGGYAWLLIRHTHRPSILRWATQMAYREPGTYFTHMHDIMFTVRIISFRIHLNAKLLEAHASASELYGNNMAI